MIIEALCTPIFAIINGFINLFPEFSTLPSWSQDFFNLLNVGIQFFPVDVWITIIGHIVVFVSAHFIWIIIEWIYKKIPGVS